MKRYKPPKPDEVLPIDAIINAGIDEFADNGLAGARIESIAKRVGVSPGLLYYYFNNKEDLYLSVLEQAMRFIFDELKDKLKSESDFMSSFNVGIMSTYEILQSKPNITRLLLRECVDGAKFLRRLKENHPEWVGSNVRLMVDKLKAAIDSGLVRPVDAERTISIFTASLFLILGARSVLELMNLSPEYEDNPTQWFAVLVDIFANALKPT